MRTMHKFGMQVQHQVLQMPRGAVLRRVDTQPLQMMPVQLWAEVVTDAPMVSRSIRCYGTGHTMPDEPGEYIGTVMLHNGGLVFHYYDEGELPQ